MAAAKKTPKSPAKKAPAKKTAAEGAAPKAPKTPRQELPTANGVTRPKDGTKTGRIWAIADEITKAQKGTAATRAQVLEAALAEDINESTVATQYQRWRTFFDVERVKAEPKPKAPKAPKAEKGA